MQFGQLKRREFITLLGGAAVWPLAVYAEPAAKQGGQPRKTHRIAVVSPASPIGLMNEASPNLFFRQLFLELRRLGYIEGGNLIVQRYSSEGNPELVPEVVAATINSAPDVIFAFSSRMVKSLKDATAVIPIVGYTADPISFGIVTNLARPGGNVTGVSTEAGAEIDGKRLSLFKEIMPGASRLAVLAPLSFLNSPYGSAIQTLAKQLGFSVVGRPLGNLIDENEFPSVFADMQKNNADAVLVPDLSENNSNLRLVIELSERARLPTIASTRQFVQAGSLMSYGPDPADLMRIAVSYIERILQGEMPGELPVQRPRKFEFILNLKTAKALGLDVPLTLQTIADEVIE
jgi:putative ABC transport system substrate-binding protein